MSTMGKHYHGQLQLAPQANIGIVVAKFHSLITKRLWEGATGLLEQVGATSNQLTTIWVPGALEMPWALQQLVNQQSYTGLLALGAVVEGETDHYQVVVHQAAAGIAKVSRQLPTGVGLLTCKTFEQALARAGGKAGNKGADAALALVEMMSLASQLAQASLSKGISHAK